MRCHRSAHGTLQALLALVSIAVAGHARVEAEFPEAHSRCGSCHLANGGERGKDAQGGIPTDAVCVDCHRLRSLQRGKETSVGHLLPDGSGGVLPASAANAQRIGCLSCHSGHAGGNCAQLRGAPAGPSDGTRTLDVTTRVCLGCHNGGGPATALARHGSEHPMGVPMRRVTAGFVKVVDLPLLDVRGTPDDTRDDVIACATCHRYHGSPNEDLLRWSRKQTREACGSCHTDIFGIPAGTQLARR